MASRADFRRGAFRLLEYLSAEYSQNGESITAPDNVQFYYKMPALFSYAGSHELALGTLEQFVSKFATDDGLRLDDDPIARPWSAYLAGWCAWGAGQLGRFDLAQKVIRAVMDRQDPEYGGFVHDAARGPILDLERSSAAGMGLVWAMEVAAAHRTAAFATRALESQRAHSTFYTYFDVCGRIVPDDDDRNAYFNDTDEHARPAVFATTIAFLVWLGRASNNHRLYELAGDYMAIVLSHKRDPAIMPLATKTGWAALMVNTHLPDESLLRFAARSGTDLLNRQESDGSINFDAVPEVNKPVEKVWHIGWGCDAALTLFALANGGA